MGTAVVTMKIMPDSTDTDLDKITTQVAKMVREFAGERDTKVTVEPVAFGLKCINFIFVMDEKLGSPDTLAEKINNIDGVQNAEVSDVRRAIG